MSAMKKVFRLKYNDKEIIPQKDRPYIIGRDIENDIVLSSFTISRRHASITFNGNDCIIEDLNSKNGTFVNQKKVVKHVLTDNDIIMIDNFTIKVLAEEDSLLDEKSQPGQESIVLEKQFEKIIDCVRDNSRLVKDIKGIKKLIDDDRKKLKKAANIDALTGIFNRRFFDQFIKREIQRDARYGHSLSLLLLDIDYFKNINDEFGHQQGDEVLRWLASKIKSIIRQTDVVARFGGEEFVLLLTETKPANALLVAEKIRSQIELESQYFVPKQFTVSMGISCYPDNGFSDDIIIKAADAALYQSKQNGRNCVTISKWKS